MQNVKTALDIFSHLKGDTIRRNSQRSAKWFINKIKDIRKPNLIRNTPKVGGLYLFAYDAKYKDKLPYWDGVPIVIVVQFEKNGFSGLNFHYLPVPERLFLLKLLTGMSSNKSKTYVKMAYKYLLGLSTTIWKFAYKKYLYGHMKSKLLTIERAEWEDAVQLPIARFNKKTQRKVFGDFRKNF